MNKVTFLYPGSTRWDALDNWVHSLGRHCRQNQVMLARNVVNVKDDEIAIVITEEENYPRGIIDRDLKALSLRKIPYGVLHNNNNVPTPGDYPSFCWTQQGIAKMQDYRPILLRQPLFPPLVPFKKQPLLVGTFGHVEPKKQTRQIFEWSKRENVSFQAFAPDVLVNQYSDYIEKLMNDGCSIVLGRWSETIDSWARILEPVSHFLFVLPESKGGTGGSPTSPRYAGLFNRPVIVVDDEKTFEKDGFYVYPSIHLLYKTDLEAMLPPKYDWSPDAYVSGLVHGVMRYHRSKE